MSHIKILTDLNKDIESLEQFWNELRFGGFLDQYDVNQQNMLIAKIDDKFDELKTGLIAYENAIGIQCYIDEHGVTDELKTLVGNEGFLESIGNALKSVGKFILNLLKAILGYIVTFLYGIGVALTFPIGLAKLHMKTTVSYKLNEIDKKADEITKISPDQLLKKTEVLDVSDSTIEQIVAEFKQKCDEYLETFAELVKEGQNVQYNTTYGEIKKISENVYMVNVFAKHQLENLQHNLDKYKSMNENQFDIKELAKLKDAFDRLGFKHQKWDKFDIDFGRTVDDPGKNDGSLSQLIKVVRIQVQFMKVYVSFVTRISTTAVSFVKVMHSIFTKGASAIEEEFEFPRDINKHLSDFYGGTVDIKKLVITNLHPEEWPLLGNPNILGGWCMAQNQQHDTTIYVTYSSFMKLFRRIMFGMGWSLKDHHGRSMTAADALIRTIVHEAKHLYDQQSGRDMTPPEGYDTDKNIYKNTPFEKDAREAQRNYEPTPSDIAWANKVIARVKELSKQK